MRHARSTFSSFIATATLMLAMALSLAVAVPASAAGGLVSNEQASRFGLVRAWFSQAQLNPSQHEVQRAIVDGDQLFVLTTAGVLHAMDAHTGRTQWIVRMGNPNFPSLGPSTSNLYVGVVNGSTLFVFDRETGLETMSRTLGGGAGGGPALTEEYAYVPMFSGKVEAYSMEDPDARAWYYTSAGRIFDTPIATPESVIWPTDRAFLYVANHAPQGLRYRFESSGPIVGEPAHYNGNIFAASATGYVYSLTENSGLQRWRYSTGSSIIQSPVVVSGRVYVATRQPALHCFSASDGTRHWETPDISQFVAASQTQVYGINRLGDVSILDAESGVSLGQLRTNPTTSAVLNADTDRLYLVNQRGLVQCLHEIGSEEPYVHQPPTAEEPTAEESEADQPAEVAEPDEDNVFEQPADEVNPFGAPADSNPFGDQANPFGGNPFDAPAPEGDDAAADDNPFGP